MPRPSRATLWLAAAASVVGSGIAQQPVDGRAHWAFAPLPRTVAVPEVGEGRGVHNPIDAFVIARLEQQGIEPAPPADAATFLRRLSLSLTGLPPDEASLDAFLADDSPDATARVADELLRTPRAAEHLAVEWLDVARYADTFGYQSDVERSVWPWRDWVVRAFADNLPYDRFVTWQVAGDLLPDATREQRLATAFQRLHRMTNEGGSVEQEMRLEYVADRTETFSTAFLGLTVGCARCHDHKFDPVSIREYYALSSFFDDIDESGLYSHFTNATPTPALALPTDQQAQQEHEAEARVRVLEAEVAAMVDAPSPGFAAWSKGGGPAPAGPVGRFAFDSMEGGQVANEVAGAPAGMAFDEPAVVAGRIGQALRFDGENGIKLPKVGDFDRHSPFTIAFWLEVPTRYERAVVLHRSRAWTDAGSRGYELLVEDGALSFALVHFWPGNAMRVRAVAELPVGRWTHVALTYDGSSRAAGMAIHVDGRRAALEVVRDGLTRTIQGGGADALTLAQRFRDRGLAGGAVDELQVFDRELTDHEVAVLAGDAGPATSQREARLAYLRSVDEPFRAKLEELRAARRALGAVRDAAAEVMVMQDMATPRETFVRPRGAYDQQGERVEPGVPACLPPLAEGRRDRLALARWLFAPDHPLTARVAVNRAWQMHFGIGLVETAEDFGTQGSPPSHPELLDWLARWFVDSGWDVRALHRLIVTSATFRQSSRASPELLAHDPHNRLLARGPRFQLSAEAIRDQALWASGLLVERLGGPPVKPHEPAGLWKEKSGQDYVPSTGDGLYRRSLYTFWKRTSPPPSMLTFDAAKRDVCAVRRHRTSTSLQALVLLNDPQHVEAARVLAERLVRDGGGETLLDRLFRRLTGRLPDARERGVLAAALHDQRSRFASRPEAAKELLAVGATAADTALDPTEVAAWTMVVSTVMNLDAVVRQR